MRRAGRIDGTQTPIVDALRDAGRSVAVCSSAGDGFPDLVVGGLAPCQVCQWPFPTNHLLEVKREGPPSRRRLTPAQAAFHGSWRGQIAVVSTVDEALRAVGLRP